MKFDMKNILIPALAAAALLASCSEWTEAENKDYLPQIRPRSGTSRLTKADTRW